MKLRDAELRDDEIADLVVASAFFDWANQLRLSPGEPEGLGAGNE